jgi:hypothetical protein
VSTLLLALAVLGSSLVLFGGCGAAVFVFVVLAAASFVRPWFVLLLGFFLFFVMAVAGCIESREAFCRSACQNNLKQIALALHNYFRDYKCFPPACIPGKNGRPAHSWRVLILPYLEEEKLYNRYDFNEPWDGPKNKKLIDSPPRGYACPSNEENRQNGHTATDYVAVVGANAAWQGKSPRKMSDIGGKASQTIMLVEAADAHIPWTEPRDLDLDSFRAGSPGCVTVSSKHFPDHDFLTYARQAGVNVALADGSVHFLPGDMVSSREFPDLLMIGGFREEYLNGSGPAETRIHWPHSIAFATLIVSSAWLLLRAARAPGAGIRLVSPGINRPQQPDRTAGT